MWCMIDSLRSLVEGLAGAFTRPSFTTAGQFLLGWVMCLGRRTLRRTAQSAQPQTPSAPTVYPPRLLSPPTSRDVSNTLSVFAHPPPSSS